MWYDFDKWYSMMKFIDKFKENNAFYNPSRSRRIKNKRRNKKRK